MKTCPTCQEASPDVAHFCFGCGFHFTILADTQPADPLIGRVLDGKYRLLERLGEPSGMGAVYRAKRTRIASEAVIKVILPKYVADASAVERFRREAHFASLIRHKNVVAIYDFEEARGESPAYIAMELVDGRSLRSVLRDDGRLTTHRAVTLMRRICAGVGAAHKQAIVHRDLKPENVIIIPPDEEDETETVKVLDFGIAKLRDSELTQLTPDGTVLGTAYYMPPEQWRGVETDVRADVYSLGVMFYEMLTGELPFNSRARDGLMMKHVSEPPPVLPSNLSVPPELEAVMRRALEKERDARPSDAKAFARELQAALSQHVAALLPTQPIASTLPSPNKAVIHTEPTIQEPEIKNVKQPDQPRASETPDISKDDNLRPVGDVPRRGMTYSKVRIFDLAKELKLDSKRVIEDVRREGVDVSVPSNTISKELAEKIRNKYFLKKEEVPAHPVRVIKRKSAPPPDLQIFGFVTLKVNEDRQMVEQRTEWSQCFKENLGGVILDMVDIPQGKFMMGTSESFADEAVYRIKLLNKMRQALHNASKDLGRAMCDVDTFVQEFMAEMPQHEVSVERFYMSKYEVTQAQWRTVAQMLEVERHLELDPSYSKGDYLPVERVSWLAATEFCARLSRATGRKYRLPSEAEWEYACRAGTETPFAFGENITREIENWSGNYLHDDEDRVRKVTLGTREVDALGVGNGWGLYEMHGNVAEWCADVWNVDYTGAPKDGSAWLSEDDSIMRVVRGGAWNSIEHRCRSAYRSFCPLNQNRNDIGFRVALSA